MQEIDWNIEVSLFYSSDNFNRELLISLARQENTLLDERMNMQNTRSYEEDVRFLARFNTFSRRALCLNGKPRPCLVDIIAAPITSTMLATVAELIWQEFPEELRRLKNTAIAAALYAIEHGLTRFCEYQR